MQNDRIKLSCILRIISMLILVFISPSCALLGLSTARQVESIFLEAQALDHSGSYSAAIEKYKEAFKEFNKPGVTLGLRPHIDENFPALLRTRVLRCCSNLVKNLFLQAEDSYHQKDYLTAIKIYKAAVKEPEKYGKINFARLPNVDEDFPTLTLINFRIASSYSKLAEQSNGSKILYSRAIAYVQLAATPITNNKYKPESYFFWGVLLHKSGKPEQAVQRFSDFVKHFPKHSSVAEASYRIGVFYHDKKNYTRSRTAFYEILNKFPSSRFKDEAHYRIAHSFFSELDYERAYQEFTKVHKRPSTVFQVEGRYYAAYCLYQLGRHGEALTQYTNFTIKHRKNQYTPAAHFAIGKIYFEKKDYKKALSNYQLALREGEKQSFKFGIQPIEIQLAITTTHFTMGKMYFGKKDYEKALASYQLALQNTKKQSFKTEIQLAIAFAYLNQGNTKNTIASCKRILSVSETDLITMLKDDPFVKQRLTIAKGLQLYLEAENTIFLAGYKGAVAKYNAALVEVQKNISTKVTAEYQADLNYILGYLFYKVERFESAEQQLTKVIDDFPDSNFVDDAWYAIGDMNYKLQSYLECRHAFRKILENLPNSDLRDEAQYLIAKSLLEELSYERAYLAFDELTTKVFQTNHDFQDDARYHAAYCLNLLSRDDMAIRRYQNFLARYPDSPYRVNAYFDLGAIYARQQDYDKARSNYALAMLHTDDQALLSEIQMAIGHAYYNQGDYRNAIVAHTLLLEKYPESGFIIEAKLGIANSHFRMKAWKEAADTYKRVINEHPEAANFTPYCAYQIGEAHHELAIDYNGEQGKTEYAVENYHKALNWYQKIIDDIPTETSDNLGEVVELLITSLTRMHNDSSVPEELQSLAQSKKGDSYLANEQYGKALGEYNTFVRTFPNSPRITSVQDKIKQVQEYIISKNLQQEKVRPTVQVPIAQQIAQKALASTVLIRIKDTTGAPMAIGSGFFINKDQIVSNWHVVEDATAAYAMSVDEKTRYNIEGILAMNPKQDLVILKVSGEGKPLSLGNSNVAQIGESIYVTGNPKGWTGTFSIGVISSFQMRYTGKRIQITAPVSPGSSGGPVLNDEGEVIGIVYAGHGGPDAQNLNLAIPVSYLKNLLKRVGPPIPLSAR